MSPGAPCSGNQASLKRPVPQRSSTFLKDLLPGQAEEQESPGQAEEQESPGQAEEQNFGLRHKDIRTDLSHFLSHAV